MNDTKIQNLAKVIEENIREIHRMAGELAVIYGMLHEELPFADPVKDRKFEDFLLRLTHFRWGLKPEALNSIISNAQEMQGFVSATPSPAFARLYGASAVPARPTAGTPAFAGPTAGTRTSQTGEMAALKS